jgi:predicted RNase H-like HicB family nuclease
LQNYRWLEYNETVKSFGTLEEYINAALATARYEKIENGTKVYAEIPALRGAWAEGRTQKQAREELREVLKGWIELQLERMQSLPAIGGIFPPELHPA